MDPILVVTKVMAELAEDEGNHVPKLSAYQVRKGVIEFIRRRFSLNEITQGQAGEALQQVVKQVSQPYSDRMNSVFPKEVEQDIVTKLIMQCCQTIPDTPYASIVHPDVTLFMLTQEWLQNEWHHIIRRWRRIYEVLYTYSKGKVGPMDNNSTTVYGNRTDRGLSIAIYIIFSWFRTGSLQNSQTVAPPAAKLSRPSEPIPDIRRHLISKQSNSQGTTQVSPRVDSIGKVKAKGESEQLLDSNRTRTVPNYSSTNRLSQWANKAPKNTEGHKANKARKTQEISGLPDNGRSFDIRTKVRNSLKSPSTTNGRSLSGSSSDDTQCGGDKPQERAQLRNEDNTAELMKKRRLEVEEYIFDSMRSLQSQEEHQLDRMQETLASVDSPTNPQTDPLRQRKKRKQHREDDRIS
jgi:hypothetical protein